jgi:uncharacterized membrane protein
LNSITKFHLFLHRYRNDLKNKSPILGTLIGADLINLRKIPKLGAPVASIGGAGTFDGDIPKRHHRSNFSRTITGNQSK